MAFKAFTLSPVFEKPSDSKDKFIIQCVETYHPNIYIGTKQGTLHHLVLPSAADGHAKKLSNSPIVRIRLVPIFNHLLALCNRTLTVLNMFSLEANPGFKKIQNVSLFELSQREDGEVWMVTCPGQRRLVRLHAVGADRWDVLREIGLPQEPTELAVEGDSVCLGTADKYLLCDLTTGRREELLQHGLSSKRQVLVGTVGAGEFLINGPGGLGLCVLASGVCQRPPLPWPQDVLAACVCFPYALCLQAQELGVYSLLDQQCKQTVAVSGALGLRATAGGALVFTERAVFSLSAVPGQQQIQALVREERLGEALLLLEGGCGQHSPEEQQELQRSITCMAGFQHFFQGRLTEARDLFIKGDLDPRELLHLFPDLLPTLPTDFLPQMKHSARAQDLQQLWLTDTDSELRYLGFLRDFLRAARSSDGSSRAEVDSALLWLHVRMADNEGLLQLVAQPNTCQLRTCEAVLVRDSRFFALGHLYQSHGKYQDAIQTWVDIVDGVHRDTSCCEVLELIVSTLSRLQDRDTVWTHAAWTLNNTQELGVQIFTKRSAEDHFPPADVLALLETYPQARIIYLEFLIFESNSEEAGHHTLLAQAYVSMSLQDREDVETRGKLRQLLWGSRRYDVSAVYEQLKATPLHLEKAIALGRLGDHSGALTLLVRDCPEPTVAEEYCLRLTADQDLQSTQQLLLSLLNIYLDSEGRSAAVLDLLKKYSLVLSGEKVLDVLPEAWSVTLVADFLLGAVRETFHQSRMRKVQKALEKARLLRHKALWMQAAHSMLTLDGRQSCAVCHKALTAPHFARTADGGLLHLDCANHSATDSPTGAAPKGVK